jgi:colanic acid/amylovoran biosynthesis glycosyltransferase
MSMKIAYLISQYPAPSHTFIRREISALRRLGLNITIFSVRPPRPEEVMADPDRRDQSETTYILPITLLSLAAASMRQFIRHPKRFFQALLLAVQHRNPGLRSMLYGLFYFLEGVVLADRLERQHIEHLHNHFANPASHVAMVASCLLKIPLSMTLHGLCDFDYPAGPLLNQKIEACTFVACATQYGRAQAMRQSDPGLWHKLVITRCGVDLEQLPTVLPKDHSRSRLRIICVGRLAPEKGQLGLVEAFHDACQRGLKANLVLVGDGPDRKAIERRVARYNLKDQVEILGRLPEERTLEEISRSDVLVLASFMEGLPVVLLEAMALSVPVIAPTIAGIPELVIQKETGLLFTAGDWKQLADCMIEISASPDLRRHMASKGFHKVESSFELNQVVRPLAENFYQSASSVIPSSQVVDSNTTQIGFSRTDQEDLNHLGSNKINPEIA